MPYIHYIMLIMLRSFWYESNEIIEINLLDILKNNYLQCSDSSAKDLYYGPDGRELKSPDT